MEDNYEEDIYFGDKYGYLYPCTGIFRSYKKEYIHQDEINKESIAETLKYSEDFSFMKPEYKDHYVPVVPETNIHFKNQDLKDEENEKNDKGKSTQNLLSPDEVQEEIARDLINFKDHIIEENGTPSDYNWEIIESIYKEHGNSVADMIQGYVYSCLDFVQKQKQLDLVKDYFNELIYYYKDSLSGKEKKDIIKKTIHLLKVARDLSLDNTLIIDVWGIILSKLIIYHLFNRDDLIELNDIDKDDLKTVFLIIAKTIKEDPGAKIHYDKCKFVAINKALYEEAMKEVANK